MGLLSARCRRGGSLPREPRESWEPRGEPEPFAKGAAGGSSGAMSVIKRLVEAACEMVELAWEAADDGRLLLARESGTRSRTTTMTTTHPQKRRSRGLTGRIPSINTDQGESSRSVVSKYVVKN